MPDLNTDVKLAALVRQDRIRTAAGVLLSDAGALATGVYAYPLPSGGSAALDAILKGTHTGTVPTARLYATQLDGVTVKGTAVAFGAYPGDNTDWIGSITTLRGERVTMVEITVPAASTFTPTKGEYSAL